MELLLHAVGVCAGEIDFVDRDDDFHLRRLGVRDGLDGLRHKPVVGCDNDNSNIRNVCTACSHRCESGVAGSVQKCDGVTIAINAIGPDVLSDSASFTGSDASFANGVNQ